MVRKKVKFLLIRIPYQEILGTLRRILLSIDFAPVRADLCAHLITDASRDGVYTHGLNRVPRFMEMIRRGVVDIHAVPETVATRGSPESWDGKRGPGNLNAWAAMERAIDLSTQFGVGAIALANTNHWMRGGTYGWQAADAGVIGICWTNTMPNLPPWGATEPRIGNNPIVIAVPRSDGHVVLDMAMSQFSYGTLESNRRTGQPLPVPGGFDSAGKLTCDAEAIEKSARPLPIGYWKGSGLSLMLDLVAALLSTGQATYQIPRDSYRETGVSQIFIAFDLKSIDTDWVAQLVNDVITFARGSDSEVRYPGERTLAVRRENLEKGIPVDEELWAEIVRLGRQSSFPA